MGLTAAPLVAGTGNNTNPVLLKVKIAQIPTTMYEAMKNNTMVDTRQAPSFGTP